MAIARHKTKTIFQKATMPAFVRELAQEPPAQQLMNTQPALYKHLMQRRAILTGMLQKAVEEKNYLKKLYRF